MPVNCSAPLRPVTGLARLGLKKLSALWTSVISGRILTQAQVDGQLVGDLPVVLRIGRNGAEAGSELLLQVLSEAALVDLADEEAGVGQSPCRWLR